MVQLETFSLEMRAPGDSLEDFKAPTRKAAEPPAAISLRLTGKTEVLKPVPVREIIAKSGWFSTRGLLRFKWFHRSLAVGGAFAILLFIVGTIIDIGLLGRSVEPTAKSNELVPDQPKRLRTPPKTPGPVLRFPSASLPHMSSAPYLVPAVVRQRPVRHRVVRAVYRPRRQRIPQVVASQFAPTTRVIYVENGLVKTRIEPWLIAARYNKSLPN